MKKSTVIENPEKDLEKYKKELLGLRIRRASGDDVAVQRFKELRKLIARCFVMVGNNKG